MTNVMLVDATTWEAPAFTWKAVYGDGTEFNEFDDDGRDHGFGEVDQSRVVRVHLIPLRPHLAEHVVAIDPTRGQRPIFFRRHRLTVRTADGAVEARSTVTVLGWRQSIGDQLVHSYTFLFDDGSSLIADNDTLV